MTENYSENDIKAMVTQILAGMAGSRAESNTPTVVATTAPIGRPSPQVGQYDEPGTPEQRLLVPHPANRAALLDMIASTPARIGTWRAGPRQNCTTLLRFRADHAAAMDAVFNDVSDQLIASMGMFPVQTAAPDKAAFLMDPTIGARFTPETAKELSGSCVHGAQIQILVADGLSSAAVEANIPDLLPALTQGLARHGLSVGTTVFVKYGRVRCMDEVTTLLSPEVTLILIGERPGLVTNESLSCYMTYKGRPGMAESHRTVVSNIYRKGTPPTEAGAYIADIAKKMIDTKSAGMDLKL